jgi:nickel-dependent lactate racemase
MNQSEIASWVVTHHPAHRFHGKRVLLIIPDGTRTAPIGAVFKALHAEWSESVAALDILIALGTHPAMSEEAICERLEITGEERASQYRAVGFFNHEWDNPAALET